MSPSNHTPRPLDVVNPLDVGWCRRWVHERRALVYGCSELTAKEVSIWTCMLEELEKDMEKAVVEQQALINHQIRYNTDLLRSRGRAPAVSRVEFIARACHAANQNFSVAHGDVGAIPWEQLGDDRRRVVEMGVLAALRGSEPEALHDLWVSKMLEEGWVYGAVKDAIKKTHPSLVPYMQLSDVEKAKDTLFHATVFTANRLYQDLKS